MSSTIALPSLYNVNCCSQSMLADPIYQNEYCTHSNNRGQYNGVLQSICLVRWITLHIEICSKLYAMQIAELELDQALQASKFHVLHMPARDACKSRQHRIDALVCSRSHALGGTLSMHT